MLDLMINVSNSEVLERLEQGVFWLLLIVLGKKHII